MWLRPPRVRFLLPLGLQPWLRQPFFFDFNWVWKQGWPRGKRWFISLMTEVGYPILYHFKLILGVSSHLAPDANHKSSRVSVILLKVPELGPGPQPFFHKTYLRSSSRPRCSISGRDGGLEVLPKGSDLVGHWVYWEPMCSQGNKAAKAFS